MMGWIGRIILAVALIAVVIKRADILAGFAKIAYMRDKRERGLKIYKIASKIGNLSVENRAYYGFLLLRHGELKEARRQLVEASFSCYKKPALKNSVKSSLALVTWKEGNLDEAIEMMEEIPIEQYNSVMYQNLGLLYILHGDKEKAVEFNLKGREYNSDDKVIMDNLAEAYALNEEYDKAVEVYEELVKLEPHFPEAYYGYGFLLIKLGRDRERALELIKTALDKNYSFLSVMTRNEVERRYNELIGE